ncbi:kunitz-type protease inhibitor 1-like protein [Lates japonicus]|uniref:Kunitz-type protease inhibitor 1-like protein n=1 Tax=Lates japonicus TaxID=270547 RepID=A0AAD3RMF9_LATJO|nr:kunitz-type protease inhibitor 1-like protein [Lates japonicus]
MPPSSSSSPRLPHLLFLLLLLRSGGAAEDAECSGTFRFGEEDFVLDAEDAAKEGAALLDTAHVQSPEACKRACCVDLRCNLALLEPSGTGAAAAANRTCVLFSCVHRNRFVCRFVNQAGYQSYIRDFVFRKYLEAPGKPIANAGGDVIVQPGEMVTLNGIESLPLGDSHITDYRWSLQSGDAGVKMEKTDLPDQVRLSDLKVGSYVFQLTVTDSNGQSDDAKVTVLVLSPELSGSYCLAPVKVGPCRAAFPRWRYDAAAGGCVKFEYGGCKPNNNNYLTEDQCLSACRGVTAALERGIISPTKEVIDGSDEEHCDKLNQTFSRLLSIDVNKKKAQCVEPPRTGPCRASYTRWYYDPLDRKCYQFTFGGCDGNGNNFEKEEKCQDTCDGVTENNVFFKKLFNRFEKEEQSDDSGSITLAVILSVSILALLAILTYCFLKARRDRSHRPVATGPAHVALSEQDTLVYNSTTKPPLAIKTRPDSGTEPALRKREQTHLVKRHFLVWDLVLQDWSLITGDSVMPEGSHSSSYDVSMGEESPRLSTASISSNERAPSATPSDSSDLLSSDRRPVSLISTLSSGSGSSRDESLAPPPPSSQTSDPEVDLDLSPAGGGADDEGSRPRPPPDRKGRSLGLVHNNNKELTGSRTSSRRLQASPFKTSMAPEPQLAIPWTVVMEMIETERMYVRDLRMIVEGRCESDRCLWVHTCSSLFRGSSKYHLLLQEVPVFAELERSGSSPHTKNWFWREPSSEGVLRGALCGTSLGQPASGGGGGGGGREEELGGRKDSLGGWSAARKEEGGRLSWRLSSGRGGQQADEILLEDEQVDDFASSVAGAISCWHYRVQAFLSLPGAVRLSAASLVFSLAFHQLRNTLNSRDNSPLRPAQR